MAGTAKHGERLEILQRHRTVFRVRTARGAEGWVDERQLLAASDMQNLKRLAAGGGEAAIAGRGDAALRRSARLYAAFARIAQLSSP